MNQENSAKAVRAACVALAFFGIAGCGGGDGGDATPTPTAGTPAPSVVPGPTDSPAVTAPGGLYVGYYQEDAVNNPEDPTAGAFVLNLPDRNAGFNGAMYFTYVGCQTSNVGNVVGIKNGNALSGTWAGTLDGSSHSGAYDGSYDAAQGVYQGVYSNAGGKQFKVVPGCIQYYIAANGSWAMFPIEQSRPATFTLTVSSTTVSWSRLPGATASLLYVIDPAIASAASGNPVVYQTIYDASVNSANVSAFGLTRGKEYVVATLVNGNSSNRLAFASRRFVAP